MFFIPIFYLSFVILTQKEPVFEPQILDSEIAIGYGLAIGDVDGDGKDDILLADKKAFVWYRNGDWKKHVMAENLTNSDNVCIAARDIDGDGKVEVAVGAQWNPGETSVTDKSGAVFYLIQPDDPTQIWTSKQLHHEPTTHRMRWVKSGNSAQLIVVPLHGRGNANGEGAGVKVIAYDFPADPAGDWTYQVIEESMHLTHNLEVVESRNTDAILLGGKEGITYLTSTKSTWKKEPINLPTSPSVGELRFGDRSGQSHFLTTIEPMHGTTLVAYEGFDQNLQSQELKRNILHTQLKDGHALAVGDFLGLGSDQIAVGWRLPNEAGEFGIKLFIPKNGSFSEYEEMWIDKNGMACEDLQAADLDGDGRLDLIASGRSTKNLKIYWNKSQ
ncbi:VCBS repeat-containing protein [Algoriphagus sp. C2-6-M1]|uniref:VCBS repeat-containing protein n=1 Tax=Algoriphagus persicinus TaxID=3108754 RepID=UPI002B3B015F|nr:VCBS repeat-containing protein [Algoriphagus sp. C2-6-M1]MEB2782370.1 VCBS repeat-containing protein [Algoriphagus sp. C2-6-M1]